MINPQFVCYFLDIMTTKVVTVHLISSTWKQFMHFKNLKLTPYINNSSITNILRNCSISSHFLGTLLNEYSFTKCNFLDVKKSNKSKGKGTKTKPKKGNNLSSFTYI